MDPSEWIAAGLNSSDSDSDNDQGSTSADQGHANEKPSSKALPSPTVDEVPHSILLS